MESLIIAFNLRRKNCFEIYDEIEQFKLYCLIFLFIYMDIIIKNQTNSIKLDTLEHICKLLKCTPNDIIVIEE
jgi:hypothetical protein